MSSKLKNINKYYKSGIGYTIGNFMLKGMVFITVPIFTRLMSTSDYGTFSTYTAWISVLSVLVGFNLSISIRNARIDYKERYEEYKSSVLSLSFIIFFVMSIIIVLIHKYFYEFFDAPDFIIYIMIIQSFAMFLITYYQTILNQNFEYKSYLLISFINVIFGVALSIFFIFNFTNVSSFINRVVGGVIPLTFIALFIIYKIYSHNKTTYNKEFWKYALAISIPIIPHSISNVVLSQSDRILIGNINGSEAVGLYSLIYNISMIINILWMSLDSVWVPWFCNKMSEKNYGLINKVSIKYTELFTYVTLGVLYVSPEIVKLLAPAKYWSSLDIVSPIVVSGYFIFLYSLPVNVEYFFKKNIFISIGTLVCGGVNITANVFLLPIYGYKIAAYTTLISYMFLFAFHWIISKRIFSEKLFDLKHLLVSASIVILGAVIFEVVRGYLIIRILLILVFTAIVFLKYKNEIIAFKNGGRKI